MSTTVAFGRGIATAEDGFVGAGVAPIANAGELPLAPQLRSKQRADAVGSSSVAQAEEVIVGGGVSAITVGELAGVTMSLADDAFFVVDENTLAMVEILVETDAAGQAIGLTGIGDAVARKVAANALAVCSAVVADMGDVFSKGTVVATEGAGPEAKQFVGRGGNIFQGARVQLEAAKAAAANIQGNEEKAKEFLLWALSGMKRGFVGPRVEGVIKPIMENAQDRVRLLQVTVVVMGIGIIAVMAWCCRKQPQSYAVANAQLLTQP